MGHMLENSEGIILSLDNSKSVVPAPFLTKTYHLVDEPSTDHIVSWGEDHSTFVVWRPPEFARDLLPSYFKHNNFSSFVRQLNTYGFRKIVPDRWEFANEYFKRGEKHLLCEIHRRKTGQTQQSTSHLNFSCPTSAANYFPHSFLSSTTTTLSPSQSSSDNGAYDFDSSSPPPSSSSSTKLLRSHNSNNNNIISNISLDNERLRRSNSMLMSELAHMRKLYTDIIYFVQNHVKPLHSTTNTHFTPINNANGNPNPTNFVHQKSIDFNQFVTKGYTTENHNEGCKTKLFGVLIQSKKRLHPDQTVENNFKARFVLGKHDLGLNLMPSSPTS
ncbi:Heat stress transcription factor B-4 [Bienertia sinuspersici]